MNQVYYDKNGCPIIDGDILKVFHFVGHRKRKHFMYKKVINGRAYCLGELGGKPLEETHSCLVKALSQSTDVEVIDGPMIEVGRVGNVTFNERKRHLKEFLAEMEHRERNAVIEA